MGVCPCLDVDVRRTVGERGERRLAHVERDVLNVVGQHRVQEDRDHSRGDAVTVPLMRGKTNSRAALELARAEITHRPHYEMTHG